MNEFHFREIKPGNDPRTSPDYNALRAEISKLSHPARPDVNWYQIEHLCLRLFEHNGVELYSLNWYIQARTRLSGLPGLNEGLSILVALLTHQWGSIWPQSVPARMELLVSLSQRLQQVLRTFEFTPADVTDLYQAEQHLLRTGDVLQRLELRQVSQTDALYSQLHNARARLESSETGIESMRNGLVIPSVPLYDTPPETLRTDSKGTRQWVFVPQTGTGAQIIVAKAFPPPTPARKPFIAGMLAMLFLGVVTAGGWKYVTRPVPLIEQLNASLSPAPQALTKNQLAEIKFKHALPDDLIERTQSQLVYLNGLPPDYNFHLQQRLIRQLYELLPDSPEALSLVNTWNQQLAESGLPDKSLSSWNEGMMRLKRMSEKLNTLDRARSGYLTVSELKSEIYAITQAFGQHPPFEERLRQLTEQQKPETSSIQIKDTEQYLKQILKGYSRQSTRVHSSGTD